MRYFIYEPEYDGVTFYTSKRQWKKAMEDYDFLGKFCDDGWSESVQNVIAGILPSGISYNEHPENDDDFIEESDFYEKYQTHAPVKFNEKQRPPDSEIDENGMCKDGYYWDDYYEYCCMYAFEKLTIK